MVCPPLILRQLTVLYSQSEDRLRLAGEDAEGGTVTLWLTLRLLDRLIPELVRWLETQQGRQLGRPLAALPRGEVLMSMAQQRAEQARAPLPPVRVKPQSAAWLVAQVDLRTTGRHAQLTFRGPDQAAARLTLDATPLRQWLGLVRQAYAAAGWPVRVWPEWLAERPSPPPAAGAVLH